MSAKGFSACSVAVAALKGRDDGPLAVNRHARQDMQQLRHVHTAPRLRNEIFCIGLDVLW